MDYNTQLTNLHIKDSAHHLGTCATDNVPCVICMWCRGGTKQKKDIGYFFQRNKALKLENEYRHFFATDR